MVFNIFCNISESKKKVLKNIILAIIGKCVSLLGVLIIGIVVARYLGKEQYGLMNYIISYVAIFQVFADFGLDYIQIREESRNKDLRDVIIGTTFFLKLLFAGIMLAAIVLTTFLFETDSSIKLYIMIYSVSVLLNTSWVARNHFTSIVWNEYIVKTEISRTIIGIIIKVSLVLLCFPFVYFIISLVIDSALLASGYIISYHKKIDTIWKWRFDKKLALHMTKQSFPLLLSGAAIIMYNRIDQLMIGNMLNNGELGLYSVAVRFTELLVFVPTIISQTVSPILITAREEYPQNYERLSSVFMNVTVCVCTIIAICTSLASFHIIYYTYGSTFIAAAPVLAILSFRIIGDALSQTSGQLIIIEGIQKYVSIRNVTGCFFCVILNYLLIERYGIKGAAVVSVITIIVSGTLSNFVIPTYRKFFYKQVKSIVWGWKDIFKIKSLLQ